MACGSLSEERSYKPILRPSASMASPSWIARDQASSPDQCPGLVKTENRLPSLRAVSSVSGLTRQGLRWLEVYCAACACDLEDCSSSSAQPEPGRQKAQHPRPRFVWRSWAWRQLQPLRGPGPITKPATYLITFSPLLPSCPVPDGFIRNRRDDLSSTPGKGPHLFRPV